jgi:hypothetical protein
MRRTLRSRDQSSELVDRPCKPADGTPSGAARRGCAATAVDIGSTIVKIAHIDESDSIASQELVPRDFETGIARQVDALLASAGVVPGRDRILVCSSANGGLRVGIVCLSKHFSGAAMRNQVLLAGANPVFLHDLDEDGGSLDRVDILLVGGGIDCVDAAPLERRLRALRLDRYRFESLVYAGNVHLAPLFRAQFPDAVMVSNPLAESLAGRTLSVFETVRRAYLDDLVYKEGVSELKGDLATGIRPTPEVVSQGLQRILANSSTLRVGGACAVLDIGGATTDLHYTVEIVRDDSDEVPIAGPSVARFVFTDLGIVASRDTLLLQLRNHPRLFEFLRCVVGANAREVFISMRESEYVPAPSVLAYGCLFLAFDRFAVGRGPGLPSADLNRIAHVVLTGGASRLMEESMVASVFGLFRSEASGTPAILIDRDYQLWVDGITWSGRAMAAS